MSSSESSSGQSESGSGSKSRSSSSGSGSGSSPSGSRSGSGSSSSGPGSRSGSSSSESSGSAPDDVNYVFQLTDEEKLKVINNHNVFTEKTAKVSKSIDNLRIVLRTVVVDGAKVDDWTMIVPMMDEFFDLVKEVSYQYMMAYNLPQLAKNFKKLYQTTVFLSQKNVKPELLIRGVQAISLNDNVNDLEYALISVNSNGTMFYSTLALMVILNIIDKSASTGGVSKMSNRDIFDLGIKKITDERVKASLKLLQVYARKLREFYKLLYQNKNVRGVKYIIDTINTISNNTDINVVNQVGNIIKDKPDDLKAFSDTELEEIKYISIITFMRLELSNARKIAGDTISNVWYDTSKMWTANKVVQKKFESKYNKLVRIFDGALVDVHKQQEHMVFLFCTSPKLTSNFIQGFVQKGNNHVVDFKRGGAKDPIADTLRYTFTNEFKGFDGETRTYVAHSDFYKSYGLNGIQYLSYGDMSTVLSEAWDWFYNNRGRIYMVLMGVSDIHDISTADKLIEAHGRFVNTCYYFDRRHTLDVCTKYGEFTNVVKVDMDFLQQLDIFATIHIGAFDVEPGTMVQVMKQKIMKSAVSRYEIDKLPLPRSTFTYDTGGMADKGLWDSMKKQTKSQESVSSQNDFYQRRFTSQPHVIDVDTEYVSTLYKINSQSTIASLPRTSVNIPILDYAPTLRKIIGSIMESKHGNRIMELFQSGSMRINVQRYDAIMGMYGTMEKYVQAIIKEIYDKKSSANVLINTLKFVEQYAYQILYMVVSMINGIDDRLLKKHDDTSLAFHIGAEKPLLSMLESLKTLPDKKVIHIMVWAKYQYEHGATFLNGLFTDAQFNGCMAILDELLFTVFKNQFKNRAMVADFGKAIGEYIEDEMQSFRDNFLNKSMMRDIAQAYYYYKHSTYGDDLDIMVDTFLVDLFIDYQPIGMYDEPEEDEDEEEFGGQDELVEEYEIDAPYDSDVQNESVEEYTDYMEYLSKAGEALGQDITDLNVSGDDMSIIENLIGQDNVKLVAEQILLGVDDEDDVEEKYLYIEVCYRKLLHDVIMFTRGKSFDSYKDYKEGVNAVVVDFIGFLSEISYNFTYSKRDILNYMYEVCIANLEAPDLVGISGHRLQSLFYEFDLILYHNVRYAKLSNEINSILKNSADDDYTAFLKKFVKGLNSFIAIVYDIMVDKDFVMKLLGIILGDESDSEYDSDSDGDSYGGYDDDPDDGDADGQVDEADDVDEAEGDVPYAASDADDAHSEVYDGKADDAVDDAIYDAGDETDSENNVDNKPKEPMTKFYAGHKSFQVPTKTHREMLSIVDRIIHRNFDTSKEAINAYKDITSTPGNNGQRVKNNDLTQVFVSMLKRKSDTYKVSFLINNMQSPKWNEIDEFIFKHINKR